MYRVHPQQKQNWITRLLVKIHYYPFIVVNDTVVSDLTRPELYCLSSSRVGSTGNMCAGLLAAGLGTTACITSQMQSTDIDRRAEIDQNTHYFSIQHPHNPPSHLPLHCYFFTVMLYQCWRWTGVRRLMIQYMPLGFISGKSIIVPSRKPASTANKNNVLRNKHLLFQQQEIKNCWRRNFKRSNNFNS